MPDHNIYRVTDLKIIPVKIYIFYYVETGFLVFSYVFNGFYYVFRTRLVDYY